MRLLPFLYFLLSVLPSSAPSLLTLGSQTGLYLFHQALLSKVLEHVLKHSPEESHQLPHHTRWHAHIPAPSTILLFFQSLPRSKLGFLFPS